MIVCSKCGMDNQLGRVFCMSCGTKLDLTHMSTKAIAESNRESWISLNWGKVIVIPLLLIVVSLVGLVAWPRADVIGAKGQAAGGRKIEGQIASLGNLKSGQRFSYQVSEEDLNGYLGEVLAKKAKLSSMSVKLMKGLVIVRTMNVFAEIPVGGGKKAPAGISIEAKCVPEGGTLRIAQASVGHLRLVGPLVKVAEKLLGKAVAAEPKNANLGCIEDIKVDDGKMSLIAGKK